MDEPITASELAEFLYSCRWMSVAIPSFASISKPLAEILELAYARSGRRAKRSVQTIRLDSLSGGAEHRKAYATLQESLSRSVKLSFLRADRVVCVYTDASDALWAGVVTQLPPDQLDLPREQQQHEPLAFVGAEFKGAQRSWTTFEKEAYAIYRTFYKLDYLMFSSTDTRVFTDHSNLLFVFAPTAIEPTLGRHVVCKVQRWALFLSRFSYTLEHVAGSDNIFADILTRWTKGHRRQQQPHAALCSLLLSGHEQVVPSGDEQHWPTLVDIRAAQARAGDAEKQRDRASAEHNAPLRKNGRL
ncbi:MAG: RNase H-like domain-containing protein [Pseudomonadota bacterium]